MIANNAEESFSQDQQGTAESRQKAKRRSKNDGDDRNFNCGCGKSYLSYPALYTHIKTKHDGVSPAGTSQLQGAGKPGRGRPKKEDNNAKNKEEEEPEEESVDLSDCMENLIQYLNELSTTVVYKVQMISATQTPLTTKEIEVNPVQDFPLGIFQTREEDFRAVYNHLRELQSKDESYEEPVAAQTDLKTTPINRILALFISDVSQHLRREFYREFVFFVLMYRRALNTVGWETKARILHKVQNKESHEFCEDSNGEYIPEISNDFITDLLPEYLKEYDLSGFQVIGPEEPKIKNAVFLTMHFCNWLNHHKYTYSRLVFNPEDI